MTETGVAEGVVVLVPPGVEVVEEGIVEEGLAADVGYPVEVLDGCFSYPDVHLNLR